MHEMLVVVDGLFAGLGSVRRGTAEHAGHCRFFGVAGVDGTRGIETDDGRAAPVLLEVPCCLAEALAKRFSCPPPPRFLC